MVGVRIFFLRLNLKRFKGTATVQYRGVAAQSPEAAARPYLLF
jgi:hypothetical protein